MRAQDATYKWCPLLLTLTLIVVYLRNLYKTLPDAFLDYPKEITGDVPSSEPQTLRYLTLDLQRSGTSDRDRLQSTTQTTEPSGLLLCWSLLDNCSSRRQHTICICKTGAQARIRSPDHHNIDHSLNPLSYARTRCNIQIVSNVTYTYTFRSLS